MKPLKNNKLQNIRNIIKTKKPGYLFMEDRTSFKSIGPNKINKVIIIVNIIDIKYSVSNSIYSDEQYQKKCF